MRTVNTVILVAVCFVVAAFCGFGFLASLEPSAHAMAWRIAYACGGAASLSVGSLLAIRGLLKRADKP
jgi:hypothetical protein